MNNNYDRLKSLCPRGLFGTDQKYTMMQARKKSAFMLTGDIIIVNFVNIKYLYIKNLQDTLSFLCGDYNINKICNCLERIMEPNDRGDRIYDIMAISNESIWGLYKLLMKQKLTKTADDPGPRGVKGKIFPENTVTGIFHNKKYIMSIAPFLSCNESVIYIAEDEDNKAYLYTKESINTIVYLYPLSSYDAAIESGYKGTEDEWINFIKECNFNQLGSYTNYNSKEINLFIKCASIRPVLKEKKIEVKDKENHNTGSNKAAIDKAHESCNPDLSNINDNIDCKRDGYLSWDQYFMSLAMISSFRSKDPHTQVGACIVNDDHHIVSVGYNGFPNGCSDDEYPWAKIDPDTKEKDLNSKKVKYPYVVHAELNAILNSTATLKGCILYTTLFPCNECAKAIIQSGIKEVVYLHMKHNDSESISTTMFKSAGVNCRELSITDIGHALFNNFSKYLSKLEQ